MNFRLLLAGISAFSMMTLTACDKTGDAPAAVTDQTAEIASAPPVEPTLPPLPMKISINEMMVALVDFSADGVWRPAAKETPLTEREWLLAEQDANNLIVAATLTTTAGTGVNDAEWVQDPDWRRWASEMQEVSLSAHAAAKARDQARLKLVGDRLVELCETCHQKFKPGLPVMGVTRFPIYPKRE